jgi:hypothetical protein
MLVFSTVVLVFFGCALQPASAQDINLQPKYVH